ncbi:hypothetical protein BVRB_5g098300 [Beta vulgaris subsp. vulgaris]|nr:hypothetical protein BVRB_5g098300 [Beta vulgaris subsp. vulgaris]
MSYYEGDFLILCNPNKNITLVYSIHAMPFQVKPEAKAHETCLHA